MGAVSPPVHLVDASLYVFRAWHSLPPDIVDADGHTVHAVHGFTRFLLELIERNGVTHIAVAFDEALDSCFRNEIYPAYKANREQPPDELRYQFARCREVVDALGLVALSHVEYEADDLIGSAVAALRPHAIDSVIVSADKDFGQLVDDRCSQWDYARDQRWDAGGVKARLGVHPHQVADYLALTGDAIDNIPGVPGIGPKTAATLLHHYTTLDKVLAKADEIALMRFRGAAAASAKLRQHADLARLSRLLTGIALDAPVPLAPEGYRRRQPVPHVVDAVLDRLRFGPLTRSRVRAL